jgi:hypothetical protein
MMDLGLGKTEPTKHAGYLNSLVDLLARCLKIWFSLAFAHYRPLP